MNNYIIKPAETPEEIDGKGYVHYKSWHETYTGLIDPLYLENHTPERCVEISRKYPGNTLVAKDGDKVIGFACYGSSGEKNVGKIYALYLLNEYQGKRLGLGLMNAAVEKLSQYETIFLWVLKGNEKAISFYKKYGFDFDGTEKPIMKSSIELRMTLKNN